MRACTDWYEHVAESVADPVADRGRQTQPSRHRSEPRSALPPVCASGTIRGHGGREIGDYAPLGFCEVFGGTGMRPHYAGLVSRLDTLGPQELAARSDLVGTILRRQGITFNVYGHQDGTERTWPLDLVPRIIPSSEWDHLERGLAQRVRVLDLFLDDLYVGDRTALRDGIVPTWLVEIVTRLCP